MALVQNSTAAPARRGAKQAQATRNEVASETVTESQSVTLMINVVSIPALRRIRATRELVARARMFGGRFARQW